MAGQIQLTVTTDTDDVHAVAIESGATVGKLCEMLTIFTGVAADQQVLLFNGRPLNNRQERLDAAGVRNDDLLVLTRRAAAAAPRGVASGQQSAMGLRPDGSAVDPAAFQARAPPQRQQRCPEKARLTLFFLSQSALRADRALLASMDPAMQHRLLGSVEELQSTLRQIHAQRQAAAEQERRRVDLLSADPFDVDAQRRIEEEIRNAGVQEAYEMAMEHTPEVFSRVIMLYVPMLVNGFEVKAFIDSGAESSFMSRACAQKCNLLRLMDTRFEGIAKGVGSQKTLGRIHSTSIKVGRSHLQCAITILEELPFDYLFGLDMLRRHQCCIDLKRNALLLGSSDDAVPFLPESECPKSEAAAGGAPPASPSAPTSSGAPSAPSAPTAQPDAAVAQLVALGFSPEQATQALAACGGNVEQAASFLFSSGF